MTSVNRSYLRLGQKKLLGGDLESLGENRSAYYPRDQSLFVYYYTMNFMQVQGLAKSRSHAHF